MKSIKETKIEMKTLNKILIAFSLVFAMSCETEALLTEDSISNQTARASISASKLQMKYINVYGNKLLILMLDSESTRN